jgi:hypothetical protein
MKPMRARITFTALLLAIIAVAQETTTRPTFDSFRVQIWKGKPATPKLVDSGQLMFRTRIREGAKEPVEFAGHYTVPRWGCGTLCNAFVIVDSISGSV